VFQLADPSSRTFQRATRVTLASAQYWSKKAILAPIQSPVPRGNSPAQKRSILCMNGSCSPLSTRSSNGASTCMVVVLSSKRTIFHCFFWILKTTYQRDRFAGLKRCRSMITRFCMCKESSISLPMHYPVSTSLRQRSSK
jgi:hypothetical protein